jgi:hypothetical protein
VTTTKTVDTYIEGLDGWRKEVVAALRELVREAAPDATGSIKWAQPVFESNGLPTSRDYIKAFKNHVNFGFWRGADLPDPRSLLQGTGDKMRHIKMTTPNDIRPDEFHKLVKAAVALNKSKGDPTRGN